MQPAMDEDDRALAEALVAGDPDAFAPFVRRYGPLLLNFGIRICGHREDAEEVLQETLLKAYRSLENLRDPGALKSWIYRIAANTCLRMRRKGKHEPERELSLEEILPKPGPGGEPPSLADWSHVPLDDLLRSEARDHLNRAILDLPKDYRIVLVLRDMEGFSTRETAEILQVTETLAKVRLHRARMALRKSMAAYMEGARR